MIKHIVFFKFKTTEDKAARMAAIKCELEKLPANHRGQSSTHGCHQV